MMLERALRLVSEFRDGGCVGYWFSKNERYLNYTVREYREMGDFIDGLEGVNSG